ncbi:MAG: beta-galactosidase, partial [Candidatus Hydrogenedentes bacterium]|nr:beta-galactosidase [Candidatus Hydrogenedentota bacterium]
GGTLDTAALDRNFAPGDTWIDETLAIDEPRRWELNDPFLYRVSVRVSMDNSGAFDEQSVRCGFRDFRFENGYFRLNGKRIFLRCSHTGNHCPLGLQLPHDPDLLRRDLLNVKVMGFNAIRFIAGVGTRYQLDLCDEIGLLVYEEPYAGWCMENSPKMAERFDESVFGMVRRDRNHPSIVMWGLLNETNDGPVFRHAADMLDDVRALDDTRMVMLNSGRWDGLADPPTLGLSLWHTEDRPDPNVSYNGTDVPITGYGVTWKLGRMALHPGPKCEFSVVRWTAPSAGRCNIAAAFEGLAEKATTDVYVLHNGAPLLEGVLNLAGNGNRVEYAGTVPVETGDRIDFVVGAGNGDYGGDTTALEATVALDSGAPADAATAFSLASNPNGAWSYGSLPQSQKPGASQFELYAKGEQIDDTGALGSLSNPGSLEWENVLNDQHCYPRVPHTAAVMRSLREYRGGGHGAGMGEEGYPPSPPAGANRKPVFLSEYGIGSAVDLVRVTRHYERLGAEYLEDAQFYRAQLDRFLQDWDRWAMADTFGRPEDYFAQCVAKMAGQRLLGLDAIRSNPDFVGYSLTGTVDQGMTGEGLTTTFREFKPGTFDAMSEGLAPLRWCLFAEPLNVYRGATVHLDAVLANEDALRPGSYTARFQVFGPCEALVLERTVQVDIPETETGHEPPLAIPVLLEDVVLDGPAGAYRFTAAFEQGAVAQGGETTFFVDDPATMPAAGAEIALCGEDAGLVEWLAKNGISARAFEAGRSVPGEVILVCGPVTPEASKALAQHVQAGATAIFLRPAGIEALVPGIEVKDIRGWLYLKDEWTKRHPIFNGLPAGGLMDYAFYREL